MNGRKRELCEQLEALEEHFIGRAIANLKVALGPTALEEARVQAATKDLLTAKLIAEVRVLASRQ